MNVLGQLIIARLRQNISIHVPIQTTPRVEGDLGHPIRWVCELGHIQAKLLEIVFNLSWWSVIDGVPFGEEHHSIKEEKYA